MTLGGVGELGDTGAQLGRGIVGRQLFGARAIGFREGRRRRVEQDRGQRAGDAGDVLVVARLGELAGKDRLPVG